MVAAHIRIAPLSSMPPVDPTVLRDLIYAHATPQNRVEHIRVRAGPHGADILAFIDHDDLEEATRTLQQIANKAITSTPDFHCWRII